MVHKNKKLKIIIFFISLIITAIPLSWHINYPLCGGFHGQNMAGFGIAAKNYFRYGIFKLKGFMVLGNVLDGQKIYLYTHHPPLVGLLTALSFYVFGEGEAQIRILSILLNSFASGFFALILFYITKNFLISIIGLLLCISHPLYLFYGDMLDPQGSGIFLSISGSIYFILLFLEKNKNKFLFISCLFLLFGFFYDWPAFINGILISLIILLNKDFKPFKKHGLFLLFFTILSFLIVFSWCNFTETMEGAGLLDSFLSRTNIATSPVLEKSSLPLLLIFRKLLYYHINYFFIPYSILGLFSILYFLIKIKQNKPIEQFLLIPSFLGILHILAFLQGAYQHDYWQIYLTFGFGLPTAHFIWKLTKSINKNHLIHLLILFFCIIIFIFGFSKANERWGDRKHFEKTKQTAIFIGKNTTREKPIFTSFPINEVFEFYSDRVFYFTYSPEQARYFLKNYWEEVRKRVGYFVCLRKNKNKFKELLKQKNQKIQIENNDIVIWKIQ